MSTPSEIDPTCDGLAEYAFENVVGKMLHYLNLNVLSAQDAEVEYHQMFEEECLRAIILWVNVVTCEG